MTHTLTGVRPPDDRPAVDAALITAAALRLFAEWGYRSTTMSDIGKAIGVRGPSLYKHVRSKQSLLLDIMLDTMHALIRDQTAAKGSAADPDKQLRLMVEAHVRYHATHREQAFVGNRELGNLDPENRAVILELRSTYERLLRKVITDGVQAGIFVAPSVRLTSYAILDMGMGVATWFRATGEHSADQVAKIYANYAWQMLRRESEIG